MTLSDRFVDAQQRVKALTTTPAPTDLLELYGLYKQATVGDVSGERPRLLDLKGRAKWDAWASRRGMSASTAMERYIALVARLTAQP